MNIFICTIIKPIETKANRNLQRSSNLLRLGGVVKKHRKKERKKENSHIISCIIHEAVFNQQPLETERIRYETSRKCSAALLGWNEYKKRGKPG